MSNTDDDVSRKSVSKEARETVNQQIKKIEMSDRKAIGLFRTNILLIGLLLTASSVIFRFDGLVESEFVNLGSLVGMLLLILASFMAGIAYTSSSYDIGISPSFVEETQGEDYEYEDFHADLEEEYIKWMRHNERVDRFNNGIITIAIILVANSIVYFVSGGIVGVYESGFTLLSGIAFVVVTVVLIILDAAIYWGEYLFTQVTG